MGLVPLIVPSVVLGIPLGTFLIRRLDAETFRRICMSFDLYVVAFGLSRVLDELKLIAIPQAYGVLGLCFALDAWLLYVFFKKRRSGLRTLASFPPALSVPPTQSVPTEASAPLDVSGRRLPNG
jgi:hypothetical protein